MTSTLQPTVPPSSTRWSSTHLATQCRRWQGSGAPAPDGTQRWRRHNPTRSTTSYTSYRRSSDIRSHLHRRGRTRWRRRQPHPMFQRSSDGSLEPPRILRTPLGELRLILRSCQRNVGDAICFTSCRYCLELLSEFDWNFCIRSRKNSDSWWKTDFFSSASVNSNVPKYKTLDIKNIYMTSR